MQAPAFYSGRMCDLRRARAVQGVPNTIGLATGKNASLLIANHFEANAKSETDQ